MGGVNLASYINDLQATKDVLLISILTAFVIGFIYMIVLRLCGGPIVWVSLVAIIVGGAASGFVLFEQSKTFLPSHKNHQIYLYGSYSVWGITALLLCCIICNIKNIRIGVNVMKCTASFIGSTPQVFLIPPFFIVLMTVWLLVFAIASLYIKSIGEV